MSGFFTKRPAFRDLPRVAFWLFASAVLWTLLSDASGWAFGIPSVLLATFFALFLNTEPLIVRFSYLPGFLIFFFRAGWNGAVDVARRSVMPRCPIDPEWVRYRFREKDARVRLLVSAIIGLCPGTLASRIEDDRLCVHVLDTSIEWEETAAGLESKLARVLVGPAKRY